MQSQPLNINIDFSFSHELVTTYTLTRLGDRSFFSVAGPSLELSMPVTLRDRDISLLGYSSRDF